MTFRHDIQALRGFAVLIIVFYHAEIGSFTAGYLGVDVFFVISGYLITSLIIKDICKDEFSFKGFYFRRAKRLLPAALTVLFLATIASLFFLTPGQYQEYKNQLLGSISFTANFALYDQTDYFASEAKTKPLLHMWSLSIEEQFYLLLPLLLFFTPRRLWGRVIIGTFIASFSWCLLRVNTNPEHAFFFLPSRAWELLLGCLVALYPLKTANLKLHRFFFFVSLFALCFVPIFPISDAHPGFSALVVCLSTVAIIQYFGIYQLNKPPSPFVKGLSIIGDYSYSLYLVHWPLFAFAKNAIITGDVPLSLRWALLLASCLGAYLLHHLVERPVHKSDFPVRKKLVYHLLIMSALVASMGLGIEAMHKNNLDYSSRLKPNVGLARICDQKDNFEGNPIDRFKIIDKCQTSSNPEILVWGDSYAMNWIPGLADTSARGIVQATRRACSPLATISYEELPKYSKDWAQRCVNFNRDVLNALNQYRSVEIVALSSIFEKVNRADYMGQLWENGSFTQVAMGPDATVKSMRDTVRAIRERGKKVVVISPPPKNKFNVGRCLEKLKLQKVIWGTDESCRLSLSKSREQYKAVYDFLSRLSVEADVDVIYLSDYLCSGDVCTTKINDTILYKDDGHITEAGSKEISKKIDLIGLIKEKAR